MNYTFFTYKKKITYFTFFNAFYFVELFFYFIFAMSKFKLNNIKY